VTDLAAVRHLLEPRSIAVVGASARPGSFGERMVGEVLRSTAALTVHLVNPGYVEIAGQPVVGSLDDIDGPVDLVLLGVGDASLEGLLSAAARRGDRSAVIFGNAYEAPADGVVPLRSRLATIASDASMALCGGGCMGYVNRTYGVRAIGYVEPDPIHAGPVALVTHSGSVFSAVLRARRGIGFTVAVSSGQELVTTTAAYLDYALSLTETKVVALVLETIRDADALRSSLAVAAARDVPVVVLPVGTSERGQSMVAAHSGAVAGGTASWEALADAHGLHLVGDLSELMDTVELFAAGRRARPPRASGSGLAAVLDSGAERALLVDVAAANGNRFAEISAGTTAALTDRLDPGLVASNPLDVWGNGADTEGLFADVLSTLATDPAVQAVALAVDLVEELDGDDSYRDALLRVAATTEVPLVVLSHLPAALDLRAAARLRAARIPVLEGTRSGLLALGHLMAHAEPRLPVSSHDVDSERAQRWRDRLAGGYSTAIGFQLLRDYGITVAPVFAADHERAVLTAANTIGYPVVLKTDAEIAHKSDVGGVIVGLDSDVELASAYRDMSARLGPRVVVCGLVASGTEVLVGAVRDANLGMLLIVGAGGLLAEQVADRATAMAPVDAAHARRLLGRTVVSRLLARPRVGPPADVAAVAAAMASLSAIVSELGDLLEAIEINPLICNESGATAVDVHLELRAP
jgi:acetate---CoA ligase (ADP-forming)